MCEKVLKTIFKNQRHWFKFLDEYKIFSIKQKVTLFVITIIDLTSFCSISLLSLFLPKEILTKGEYINIFGINIKIVNVINFVSSLLWGVTLPKFGAKNVFLVATIVSRICTTLFGGMYYIQDLELYEYLAYTLKCIEALGTCAYFIAGYAIVFSIFPEELGIIRGLLETVAGIGTNIGPALGEILFSTGGSGLPFVIVGVSILLLAIGGSYFLENVGDCEKSDKSLLTFMKIPDVVMTFLVILVVSVTTTCIQPAIGEHLTKSEFFTQNAFVCLVISLSFALTSPIWGYFAEKETNFSWMIPSGLYLTGFSLFCLEPVVFLQAINQSKIYRLLTLLVMGITMALTLVPTFRCLTVGAINKGFPKSLTTHSYVCATWSFMYSLGEIFGTILNVLFQNYNISTTATIMSAVNIIAAIVYTTFLIVKDKNRNIFCKFHVTINLK